jgi:PAT family acetyl-CoA transporter-like MFS transporter 1
MKLDGIRDFFQLLIGIFLIIMGLNMLIKNNRKSYFEKVKSDADTSAVISDTESLCHLHSDEPHSGSNKPIPLQDKLSMVVLLILYSLQGIPMGLSGSIPLILKERNVSFEGLALFSLVSLPFSLKLLWAPLVDSVYINMLGRRKTWLIPTQLLCGFVMIAGSQHIDRWISPADGAEPELVPLTCYFFFLYFLMATQDVAVDGWAITMLSKENRGYGATCNSIGQSLGFFLANQGFIALSDSTWCRRYLGFDKGETLVSLPGFMIFWGVVFIVVTILVWVFKEEAPLDADEEPLGLIDTYKEVIAICRLKNVQYLCIVLLTCKIAFAPADSVFSFKLQEYGFPKSDIATISPLLLVIGLVLPAIISSRASSKPLDVYLEGIPLKILTSGLVWVVFELMAQAQSSGTPPSYFFYCALITVMVLHEVAGTLVFISMMSFFNKVADPLMGGTYMTLLNTVANLGTKWPNSSVLWLLPKLTRTQCVVKETASVLFDDCAHHKSKCTADGGICSTILDGFTVETGICVGVGVLWLIVFYKTVKYLQVTHHTEWSSTKIVRVDKKSEEEEESKML